MDKKYRVALFVETSRAYGRSLCEGIAAFAQENGHWVFQGGGDSWSGTLRALSDVDGIIARIQSPEVACRLTNIGVPIVDLFGWSRYPGIALADADHAAIGRLAAGWFLERRFRHFGFCGYAGAPFSDLRGQAFAEALQVQGGACSLYKGRGFDAQADSAEMILHRERYGLPPDHRQLAVWVRSLPKPCAVFCCHDVRAHQLVTVCKELGIDVPGAVAVMGVDDDRILCGLSYPMLTSIDPDAFRIGWSGARLLFEMMLAGPPTAYAGHVLIRPRKVVPRASTETDPVDPPWLAAALRFIRQGLAAGVNADDVFRHVGFSHTQVERVFRQVLGSSVQQEIIRLRLGEAVRLLEQTDLPVVRVGQASGFNSPQYFSRSFRRHRGCTPEHYRRLKRSGCTETETMGVLPC